MLDVLTKNGPYFAILFGEAIFCRDFLNSERFFITVCVLGFYVFVRLLAISKVLISACQSTFLTLSSRQFDVVISVISSCQKAFLIASTRQFDDQSSISACFQRTFFSESPCSFLQNESSGERSFVKRFSVQNSDADKNHRVGES